VGDVGGKNEFEREDDGEKLLHVESRSAISGPVGGFGGVVK
jgi:hypothetical protein